MSSNLCKVSEGTGTSQSRNSNFSRNTFKIVSSAINFISRGRAGGTMHVVMREGKGNSEARVAHVFLDNLLNGTLIRMCGRTGINARVPTFQAKISYTCKTLRPAFYFLSFWHIT